MVKSAERTDWGQKISNAIARVFKIIKGIFRICIEIIQHCMSSITYLFGLLMGVLANPTMPCVVAIIFFIGVSLVAGAQWFQIGVWLGRLIGLKGAIAGYSTGFMGMLLGLGINIYQISPELWKLRKDFAKAYNQLGVDPDHDTSNPTIKDKVSNWFSYDHGTLKKMRLVSYCMETSLVVGYCGLVQHFQLIPLVQAAASLLLPEKALAMVSSTVGLLGEVNEKLTEPGHEPKSKPGGRPEGFSQPPGGKPGGRPEGF